MTHARTLAALASAAIALTLAPQVYEITTRHETTTDRAAVVREVEFDVVEPLPVIDRIDGVRVVNDDVDRTEFVRDAVARFDRVGWPLTNTEVRFEADGCTNGARAFHAYEDGHQAT